MNLSSTLIVQNDGRTAVSFTRARDSLCRRRFVANPRVANSPASGNSIAVIGDDGVLVFDTGNIPGSTRRQIAEIRRLTDKPVRFVVNSHWHPDHNLGNAEYRKAFPGVSIISFYRYPGVERAYEEAKFESQGRVLPAGKP